MKKKAVSAMLAAVLFAGVATPTAFACYGVRAMGMGGAFIAVADDVQAVYWNPAGMANIKEKQFGWQRATNNRESMNYIDVFEFAMPLAQDKSGIGLHYTNNRETPVFGASSTDYAVNYKSSWWTLSYGQKISEKLAVGINVRQEKQSADGRVEGGVMQAGASSDTAYSTDLGFLYKESEKLSFGLLIQDSSGKDKSANWRPAVAYRPDKKTILAFDVYNATEEFSSKREYSIGVEHKLNDNLALRVGNYHGSMTYGAGVNVDKNVQLNVAYLAGDLGGTTMLGMQTKF
ncbi:hypothetical protein [Azotosporobacter soli]|uniref:hypothetical protein n=1 Tax=Azotosporobacter soli TaxID=3055040 RepID=UPI0031FE91D9